ncbi:alpha/beta-hydrolase family protein [Gordonia humi]|uniref:alpha/beta-hydrolase family protein n=1 Tax=Gordonia humi TaxID=686429 RepID=UPI00360B2BD0
MRDWWREPCSSRRCGGRRRSLRRCRPPLPDRGGSRSPAAFRSRWPRRWSSSRAGSGRPEHSSSPRSSVRPPRRTPPPDVPTSELLTYSRLDDRGFDARAEALVDAWAAAGGAGQDAVVVGVPTGSGWLDSAAVDGFDRRFRGSVRFVSMQYSQVPSWQAYVRSSDGATRSAIAVVRALDHRLHDGGRRPAVYLYGQSLGAIGADAARAWAQRNDVDIAGTVVSGAPAGTIEALPGCARRVSIANATDPVAEFSASLLWRPADDDGTRTVGVEPSIRVPWTPVVSLFGAALDLAVSLNGPVGTGHHYGVEQGLAVAQMPRGCQPTGPRAAS